MVCETGKHGRARRSLQGREWLLSGLSLLMLHLLLALALLPQQRFLPLQLLSSAGRRQDVPLLDACSQ